MMIMARIFLALFEVKVVHELIRRMNFSNMTEIQKKKKTYL